MKDILLITNYWHFECEKASSRYLTLAKMIIEHNMNLEIVTSSFYHASKLQRQYDEKYLNSFPYKISLIKEPGYLRNISIRRWVSHREFSKNVLNYIQSRKKPDVIYCAVPSLDVAYRVTKYANQNDIKVVIDIQDLWPEAFRMVLNIPLVSSLLFMPMKYKANKIYAAADEIVAVSQSYVESALRVNKKCEKGHSVYIGIELSTFDCYASDKKVDKPSNEFWVAYVGTLGHSYDITTVLDAIKKLEREGIPNIKFLVMGDGPLRNKFEDYAKMKNINAQFTGKLDYNTMVGILTACDIAVNPITRNSAASIINKHADYVGAGLPVINTQESPEFRNLLRKYNAGINCKNNDSDDLAEKIKQLYEDEALRKVMGMNSRRLAEEKFDRLITYSKIISLLK